MTPSSILLVLWLLHGVFVSLLRAEKVYRYDDDFRRVRRINESVGIVHNAGTTFYPFVYSSDQNPTVAIKRFCIEAEIEDDVCINFTEGIEDMLAASGLERLGIGSFLDDVLLGPVSIDWFAMTLHFHFNLDMLATARGCLLYTSPSPRDS